ncbi:MAG: hypothetical protein P8H03_01485 [Emcibacteraceae bacterium]|nr:hypothetical protein [Emcibacteraceae bacterium]MDG1995601.1 hypothetical protein [Emcibacteraceae bacterium]
MSEINYSDYSIANVFKNTFKVMIENPMLYGVIAFVFVVIELLGAMYFNIDDLTMVDFSPMFFMSMIFYLVLYFCVFVFVTDNTYGTLSNQEYQGGPYLTRILSILFPMIGLCLVMGVFIGIGFLLLIIPGIYLMLKYYVALPVKIIENRSIFDTMSRSDDLTNGHKMSVFFTVMIVFVVIFIFMFGATMLLLGSLTTAEDLSLLQSPFYLIISSILNAAFSIFGIIFPTAIYYELSQEVAEE